MARLVPIDYDPFAPPRLVPVDHDPFDVAAEAERRRRAGTLAPADEATARAETRRVTGNARRAQDEEIAQQNRGFLDARNQAGMAPADASLRGVDETQAAPPARDITPAHAGAALGQGAGPSVFDKTPELDAFSQAPPEPPGPNASSIERETYRIQRGSYDRHLAALGRESEVKPGQVSTTPADTWTERAGKFLSRTGDLFSETFNGFLMREAESHGPHTALELGSWREHELITNEQERLVSEARQHGDLPGQRAFQAAQADLAENNYNFGGATDSYLTQAAESLIQMLPVVAAGIITRGRSTAGELAAAEAGQGGAISRFFTGTAHEAAENAGSLGTLYEQQAGQQYGQSRAEGRSPSEAMQDSMVFGFAEAIPEAMPMGALMRPGGRFLPRMARTAGFEGASEMLTQAVEDAYSTGVIGENMTWGQAWRDIRDAGVIGGIMGGGMTAAEHPFHRPGADDHAAPTEAPPEPGIREAAAARPPVITPEDHASPLPTEDIAAGKKIIDEALAGSQADSVLEQNGHQIGDNVAVNIGGQERTGTIKDAFVEEDPETGTQHGAVVEWHHGPTTRERIADLRDAGARITRTTPLNEGNQPTRFSAHGWTVGDGYGANRGDHTHHGVDIFAAAGTAFPVGRDFTVTGSHRQTSHGGIGGNIATVQFEDGSEWMAMHLPDLPQAGHYAAGAEVLRSGHTGAAASTAAHIHWQPVNALAHSIYNQGRRAVADYLMGGATAPDGSAQADASGDGATPTEAAQPEDAWVGAGSLGMTDEARAAAQPAPDATLATEPTGDGTRAAPIDATTAEHVDLAAANAAPPTDAQAEAGNYEHGHVRIQGLDISIETPRGAERTGTAPDGTPWSVTMPAHYGYLKRTTGADEEQVDAYIGSHPQAPHVYVVDQNDVQTGSFDEHKALIGYPSEAAAREAYHQGFSDGRGPERVGAVTTMTVPEFKAWLGETQTAPAADSFDAADWNAKRDATITASREAGTVHLDQIDPSVETMRGKAIYNVHDPKEQGVVRTVSNDGDVVVHWNDAYSAEKNLAEQKQYGNRTVHETWLMPTDLKDYAVAGTGQTAPPETGGNQPLAGVETGITSPPKSSADIGQFDPEPHLPAMRDYIAKSTGSLNDTEKMGKALNLTSEQTHRVMGALAARANSGIRMTKGRPAGTRRILLAAAQTVNGKKRAARYRTITYRPAVPARFQRIGTRTAPLHFMEWVRAQGGVRSDRHDLRNVAGIARHPGVINNKTGLSLDALGERMAESGWSHERPTEADVLDMLATGSTAKVYRPEDSGAITEAQNADAEGAKASADEEALRTLNEDFGLDLNDDDLARALEYVQQGKAPIQALTQAANDAAVDALEAGASETGNDALLDVPEAAHGGVQQGSEGASDRGPAEAVAGPEGQPQDAQKRSDANAQSDQVEQAPGDVERQVGDTGWSYVMRPDGDAYVMRGETQRRVVGPITDEKLARVVKEIEAELAKPAPAQAEPSPLDSFNRNPDQAISDLSDADLAAVAKALGLRLNAKASRAANVERIAGTARADLLAAYRSVVAPATDLLGQPAEPSKGAKGSEAEPQAEDMFGLQPGDTRRSLERQGEGRKKSDAAQKPPGSDGGLLDTRDTTGDIEKLTQPESNPVEQAKAVLQNALDVLNGKATTNVEPPPAPANDQEAVSNLPPETPALQSLLRDWEVERETGRKPGPRWIVRRIDDKSIVTWSVKKVGAEAEAYRRSWNPEELELARVLPRNFEGTPIPASNISPLVKLEENPMYQRRLTEGDDPIFYSALERAVSTNPTTRASAAQWIATLSKTPGVKKEEMEWSGIFDWLDMQTGPVSRDDLLGVIRDGGIKVEEVVLGGDAKAKWNDAADAVNAATRANLPEDEVDRLRDIRDDLRDQIDEPNQTKFPDWSSDPSSDSYRELLITLPVAQGGNPARAPATHWDWSTHDGSDGTTAVVAHARFMEKRDADGKRVLFVEEIQSDWHQKGRDQGYEGPVDQAVLDKAREAAAAAEGVATDKATTAVATSKEAIKLLSPYALSTVAEINKQVATIEGVTPDQREQLARTLERQVGLPLLELLEQLAEDDAGWVSPFDLEGYYQAASHILKQPGGDDAITAALDRAKEAYQDHVHARQTAELRDAEMRAASNPNGIPEAPFKASWPALVMKRMIRWAVDNGYERIAWTTGAEQNERYNLEAAVGQIEISRQNDGYHLNFETGRANTAAHDRLGPSPWTREQVIELLGSDLGKRAIAAADKAAPPEGALLLGDEHFAHLSGEDLKIGGEGMRGFYDRNLVNIANDLIKKHGGKVGPIPIEGPDLVKARRVQEWAAEHLAMAQQALSEWEAMTPEQQAETTALWRKETDYSTAASLELHSLIHAKNDVADYSRRLADAETEIASLMRGNPGFDITEPLADAARSGFPLFAYQRAQSTPVTDEQAAQIAERLHKELDRLGISDRIALQAANGLLTEKGAQGAYFRRAIKVSLDTAIDPMATLNHESIHAMKALGLFNTSEWTALTKQAWADPGVAAFVRKGGYGTLSDAKRDEEAVAEFYARWRAQRLQARGFAAKAFQRLLDFIHALGRAVAMVKGDLGAGTVARRIESGKVGRRETGAGLEGATAHGAEAPAMQEGGFGFDEQQPEGALTPEQQRQKAEIDARQQQDKARRGGQVGIGDQAGGLFSNERDQGMLFQTRPTASEWSDRLNRIRDATGALKTIGKRDKIAEAAERLRINLQDRMLPIMKTQTAIEQVLGRPLTDEEQPYRQEALYTGKVGDQFEQMTDNIIEPLFEAMQENGVNTDDLESYLYARHAPERNAKLSKEGVQDGSGMSDIEAAAILNRIDKAGKTEALNNVAVWYDKLNDFTNQVRIDGGTLSQESLDQWRGVYKNYAPLRGFAEMPEEERPNGGQSGYSVKGPESRRAFGRKSLASDILAHTISQAQEAVVRAEKNRIAVSLYNLAKANPDPNFWQIHKVVMRKRLNKETGMVETYPVTNVTADDALYTVNLKVDGKAKRVTFNRQNPAALRAADAMRRINDPDNFLISTVGALNRWLSKVNTTFSADFIYRNAIRDLETVTANLSEFDMKGLRRDVLKSYPKALAAAERAAFKREGDGEWDKAWRDYSANGGRVAFNQMETVEKLQKDIQKRFKQIQGQTMHPKQAIMKSVAAFKWMFDQIENFNQGVEGAARLSVYKNIVDRGVSQRQAAFIAKEISVNFNRKGVYGPILNTLYLFANASMQGNARLLMAMKHRRVQKVAASMVVSGALIAMFNAAFGGDDDDGVPYYDKVSDFEKRSNLIFMLPGTGGRYIKIPMAYGYNIFPDLGRQVVDWGRGRTHALDAIGGWLDNAANSFNPIGGSESIGNFLAPTVVDPVVDLYVDNRDFADRPIMPDQPAYGPPRPDSQRYWPSVPPYYRALTDALNRGTGGDTVQPGRIDVSPETLDYLTQQAFGAAGATVTRFASSINKVIDGNPDTSVEINDIPVLRTMIGAKPSWYDRAAFNQRLRQVQETVQRAREYRHNMDTEGQRGFVAENRDVLELHRVANAAQKEIREIRRTRARSDIMFERGRITSEQHDEIRTRMRAREERLISRFDAIYMAHVADPLTPQR